MGEIIVDLSRDKTYVVDEKYIIDINRNSKVAFMFGYEISLQNEGIERNKSFKDDVNLVVQYISNDPADPGIAEMRKNIGSLQK